jgi:ABC-type multidrug transport system permease subunit
LGGALTSAAAFTLVGYWVVSFLGHGGSSNPYVGIIFYLLLPGLFILGLVLIAVGILLRRQHLKASGQIPSIFPNC